MTTSTEREPLTDRQQEVLTVIRERSRMYGPSVREIGKELGIASPNGVVCHLKCLERKGYIRRSKKITRGIEVVS
jgi:repressor LexA